MENQQLKNNLIERIKVTDNINILKALQAVLNTFETEQFEMLKEKNQSEEYDEIEDFSSYIKEWLKNM